MGKMTKLKVKTDPDAPEPAAPVGGWLSKVMRSGVLQKGAREPEVEAPDPNARPSGLGLAGTIAQRQWDQKHANEDTDPNGYKPGGTSRALTAAEIAALKKKRGSAGQTAIETLGGD